MTNSSGSIRRPDENDTAQKPLIDQYAGTDGGINFDSLSNEVINVILNSGNGSNGLTIIEKTIDSLDPTPLETNALHIIAPDELTADNNVLTLPDGAAGDVVVVLDGDMKFADFPVVIQADKKIDGFDTITMDMKHCYLEFIFSETRDSWITRDPLFAPVTTHSVIAGHEANFLEMK